MLFWKSEEQPNVLYTCSVSSPSSDILDYITVYGEYHVRYVSNAKTVSSVTYQMCGKYVTNVISSLKNKSLFCEAESYIFFTSVFAIFFFACVGPFPCFFAYVAQLNSVKLLVELCIIACMCLII